MDSTEFVIMHSISPRCNTLQIFQPCSVPIVTNVVWNAQNTSAHLRSICTWNVLSVLFYYREIRMWVYCTAALHMWNAILFTTVALYKTSLWVNSFRSNCALAVQKYHITSVFLWRGIFYYMKWFNKKMSAKRVIW